MNTFGKNTARLALLTSVGIAALSLVTASGQEEAPDEQRKMDTVMVTAQQREQNLQEVPITLQVISDDTLATLAADNIGDVDAFVPGLEVSDGSPTQPRYKIRGIQTSDFGVGTDPAVGIYVDGVYAARTGASLLAFNDVERIEVIKGPQGTLFGRNSAAGAVSITTRKPSDEFEAELGVRLAEYNKRRVEALLNLPVNDKVAIRLNGVMNKRDGIYTDAVTGRDLGREDNWAVKGALRWDVTPNTRAILTYTHDELDQDARPAIGIVTIPDAPGQPSYPVDTSAYLNPFNVEIRNDVINNSEARELDEIDLWITHDIGSITLASTTAYRTFDTNNREDEDGTNRIDLYFDTENVESNESFYQELRATGETGSLNWVVGASYYDESADQRSNTFAYTDTVNTALGNLGLGTPFSDIDNFVLIPNDIDARLLGNSWTEDMINHGDFKAYAVFADVIWEATDRLSLTGGVRYTKDEKSFSWLNDKRSAPELDATLAALEELGILGLVGASPADFQFDLVFDMTGLVGIPCDNGVTVAEGVTCELNDEWSNVSPRFVVDYKLTDDILFFASYAKGYKAGGFNMGLPDELSQYKTFGSEVLYNYEVGYKGFWFGGDLTTNVAAFYMDRLDQQVDASVQDPDSPQNFILYTTNAGRSNAFGGELEIHGRPLSWMELDASLGLLHAEYQDYSIQNGDGTATDISGRELAHAPTWNYFLAATFRARFGLFGRLSVSGMDRFYYSDSNDFQSDSWTKVNVKLGYEGDNWGVYAWGRNIFNTKYGVRGFYFGNDPSEGWAAKGYVRYGDPIQFGLTGRIDFN